MSADLRERFLGALMGVMVGDALGRGVKDRSPEELATRGDEAVEMLGGFTTEDTEMTFVVGETLLAHGVIDPDALAQRLGAAYSPMRGYNPGLLAVLERLQQGVDWREANREVFPDGSYGFGASCRAVPIGLYYHAAPDEVVAAAAISARVTHAHVIGEAGAVGVALGTRLAVLGVPPHGMVEEIRAVLQPTGYDALLPCLDHLDALVEDYPTPVEVVARIGNKLTVQACVTAALYCLLRHPDSFEQAVRFAARLGGDADTIAAITGGLSGAYHGLGVIPDPWLWMLENGERGRDAMFALGERLHAAATARAR